MPDVGDDRKRGKIAFELGCSAAAITYGHPLGYLPTGFLAVMIFYLVSGSTLEEAISNTMLLLVERPEYEKSGLAAMIARAVRASIKDTPCPETIEWLGGSWVGDETLAISLYCAMVANGDFARCVRLTVNLSGDSDSTGAITGNILGALLGKGTIPAEWTENVEMCDVVESMALDMYAFGELYGRAICCYF